MRKLSIALLACLFLSGAGPDRLGVDRRGGPDRNGSERVTADRSAGNDLPMFHAKLRGEWVTAGPSQLLTSIQVANGNPGTLLFDYRGEDATSSTWPARAAGEDLVAEGSGGLYNLPTIYHDTSLAVNPEGSRRWAESGTGAGAIGDSDFIIEMVAYVDDTADNYFLHFFDASPFQGWGFLIDQSDPSFVLYMHDGDTVIADSDNFRALGAWYHVLVFADRSGSAGFYINGAAAGSESIAAAADSLSADATLHVSGTSFSSAETESSISLIRMWTLDDIGTHDQSALAAERYDLLFQGSTGRGGIDQLAAIDGMTPLFAINADDSSTTTWTAESGADMSVVEVSTDVTIDERTPTHGADDKGVLFASSDYFDTDDSTTVQIPASVDIWAEWLLRTGTDVSTAQHVTGSIDAASPSQWFRLLINSGSLSCQMRDGTQYTLDYSVQANTWYYLSCGVNRDENSTDAAKFHVNAVLADSANTFGGIDDLNTGQVYSVGANPFGAASAGVTLAVHRIYTGTDKWSSGSTGAAEMLSLARERFTYLTGFMPLVIPASPSTATRDSVRPCFKEVAPGERMAFNVGPGWLCNEDNPYTGRPGYTPFAATTNDVTYSEDLTNAAWSKNRVSIGGSVSDPWGRDCTTCGIISSADNDTHNISFSLGIKSGDQVDHMYCKSADKSWIQFSLSGTGGENAYFDLDACDHGTESAAGIATATGGFVNGWCHVEIKHAGLTSGSKSIYINPAESDGDKTFAGDGSTVDVYCIGAQSEDGTLFAHPYVATSGSTAASQPDVLSYALGNYQQGSLVVTATPGSLGATGLLVDLYHGANDRALIYFNGSDNPQTFSEDSGVTQWSIPDATTPLAIGTSYTLALSFIANDIEFYVDGTSKGTDTSANIDVNWDEAHIGHQDGGFIRGHTIEEVSFFKQLRQKVQP